MGTKGAVRWLAAAAVLMGALTACSSSDGSDGAGTTTTAAASTAAAAGQGIGTKTLVPGKAWTVEKPAQEGMDAADLEKARTYAFADGKNTQGVVVVRHGVIVSEWYTAGADADSWVASWSVAKSFSSAVTGIAVADGKIAGVDEPAATYLTRWKGTDKAGIRVEDILHMQSGLQWDEDYDPTSAGSSDVVKMGLSKDELAYAASRPVATTPGTRWLYSSGDAMILSGIIEGATGMPAGDYAEQKLFKPIGMERAEWWKDAEDQTLGYCCLDSTARGFARFGLLYLHDGRWGDQQVVPASWVHDSVQDAPGDHPGYGYMWWLPEVDGVPKDLFAAEGHDGQFIYVIPSLDLVVVRTGTYVKDPGPAVADPNLFGKYPPDDLVPGKGTKPPDSWDDAKFLAPIAAAVQD
ncbi:serine hydrolase domain-containing protein [Aquihabitans sp. McL0605]|uniref:serine hydrolase domain-containing protein n=1 Tax=Aquihabitans sp. McL0605 TaxID=3415671 RepID=UPI003CF2EA3C